MLVRGIDVTYKLRLEGIYYKAFPRIVLYLAAIIGSPMKKIISFFLRKVPRKYLQLFSHIGLRILAVFYAGSKVQCTVCENKFRKFLPYGYVVSRENALCPKCLALERHRLMWVYLKRETDFFTAPLKVLHVAPELCFIKRFENSGNLDYITGDLESPLAKVKMDVHEIPFDDNTFDVLFCNHVLEHVEDDIAVMKEIRRVMKPGGWAILQSPQDMNLETTYEDKSITDPKEREKHFGQYDHLRMYGRDYGERLASSGFEVKPYDYAEAMTEEEIAKYCFMKGELVYVCYKPMV